MSDKSTVLVVENEPDLQELIEALLDELDLASTLAEDGLKALSYLEVSEKPALILLDYQMPNMNGAEFRVRQLSNPKICDIPVIVMTGMSELLKDAKELTGLHYLRKPFGRKQFHDTVRRALAL